MSPPRGSLRPPRSAREARVSYLLRAWSAGLILASLATAGCGGGANDSPLSGGDVDASLDVPAEAADAASENADAPSDTSTDAPKPCATSDDCPTATALCQVPLCASSVCTTAPAADGTDVPVSAQQAGDCKKVTCGAGGAVTTVAEATDLPADDGNPCTDEVCTGPNPGHPDTAVGTACILASTGDAGVADASDDADASAASGLCNGAGVCGVCMPGAVDCSGTTPRTCEASGAWKAGDACPFVCTGAGQCAGVCVPGATYCQGIQPRVCDASGQWQPNGATCPFVCSGAGTCSGVCPPGTRQCSGSTTQTCDAMGAWVSGDVCPFACDAGLCGGVCVPGNGRCVGTSVQTCTGGGQWTSTTACPFVCANGECSGSCVPGTTQCAGVGSLTPQTCNATGQWEGATPCSQQACVAGACQGACAPSDKRCSGQAPEFCDSTGAWQQASACSNQACVAGTCVGSCAPGTLQCTGSAAQTCDATGAWNTDRTCAVACSGGVCQFDSCAAGGPGMTDCGTANNESCCTSLLVTGGTFDRSYDAVTYTDASYPATVSDFKLDEYEITVGRFRQFVAAWDAGWRPAPGAGKHVQLNGGQGLADSGNVGSYEAGWDASWASNLATAKSAWDTNLSCGGGVWTSAAGANEKRPIVCVGWYDVAAFCIWDGGFLPSEAEWNYAAAGGSEQRAYPWSSPSTSTTINDTLAVYFCGASCSSTQNVGSKPGGNGRWGQSDLAGNVGEWTLDWYGNTYSAPCNNCALTTGSSDRVGRGGGFYSNASYQLASSRGYDPPWFRHYDLGARCSRSPL